MNNFDLKKYLAESRLLKEDIDREIVSYIADTYIQNAKDGDRRYADFLDLNIRDAVQDVLGILQSSGHPLHDETKEEYSIVKRDKAKGIFETEGRLFEDDDTTYALHITTVEYDNGENGYMYELVDLDTGEEVGSKIGFKPLYFIGNGDVSDRQALPGRDFNDIKTYGMYQDEVVDKETALYIYNGLLKGDDFYGDKLSFDPRELAPM